jgi:hypothetical protein
MSANAGSNKKTPGRLIKKQIINKMKKNLLKLIILIRLKPLGNMYKIRSATKQISMQLLNRNKEFSTNKP